MTAVTDRTDQELVNAIVRGDGNAFDGLWRRYESRLRGALRSVVFNIDELEDVVQETAIRAWRAFRTDRYTHQDRLLPWLCRIARNVINDRPIRPEFTCELSLGIPDPSRPVESEMVFRDLWAFLNAQLDESLSDDSMAGRCSALAIRKTAFILYYVHDCTLPEVVEVLGAECTSRGWERPSSSAVNNWLSGGRLLKRLVKHLVLNHRETLEKLGADLVEECALTQGERNARSGIIGRPEQITASARAKKHDVQALDSTAIGKIVRALSARIADDLHSSRFRRTGCKVKDSKPGRGY